MPSYSLMRYPGGSQEDPIAHWGHQQPYPERSPQVGVSAMGLMTPEIMLEEILVLYQEVYQLNGDLGEVQCSDNAAGEAHSEIFEVLKA